MVKYNIHEKINIRSYYVENLDMKVKIPYEYEGLHSYYQTNNFAVKPYFKTR